MTDEKQTFSPMMTILRRRRLYLWVLIAVYLPAMWTAQRITGSFWDAMPVFWTWFVLILVVVTLCALAKCPNCGNYFHMNGTTLLVLRKCLHCQLHITAQEAPADTPAPAEAEAAGTDSPTMS